MVLFKRLMSRMHASCVLALFGVTAGVSMADGPHKCTTDQPVAVYKINDDTWCETFCIPTELITTVEEFGDVHNGTCAKHAYSTFDHSLQYPLYGALAPTVSTHF